MHLQRMGHKVLLVSSGAVGTGMVRLGLRKKPKTVAHTQAVAAVGQGRLMNLYDSLFQYFNVPIAQILLTRDNLAERIQYLNACSTLRELLGIDVVPIINENDSVSSSEIRFGDNDSLAAITAGMINANYLFVLTDVDCVYTDNPHTNPDATPIRSVSDLASLKSTIKFKQQGSALGTGGMVTKLIAAELATSVGCSMIITLGSEPQRIPQILECITSGKELTFGTLFEAKPFRMDDRHWWILHGLAIHGTLVIDEGAESAITSTSKSSLFAAGIRSISGSFNASQCVAINSQATGATIARGIVNYSSGDISRIMGCKSSDINQILGYCESEYVVHRGNIALV